MQTYIIAEVGPNHNGSLKMAKEYIRLLSGIGVNAIKFQLGDPKKIYSKDSFLPKYHNQKNKKNIIKSAKARQLPRNDHIKLYNLCKKNKIDYLCTAFDLPSLKFLDKKFKLPFFKIASGEIQSIDMLEYISNKNKPIILSTGMSSNKQIDLCFKYLNKKSKKKITLMHCISSYPTSLNKINMRSMLKMKSIYGVDVGFSDHTEGNIASMVAVSLGAKIIEKHVTLDKSLEGPDHKSSSTIEEFKQLVKDIRKIEIILGSFNKKISKDEYNNALSVKKSIVTKKIIRKNEKITTKNICFKRPGFGISPFDLSKVINKKVNKKIDKDKILNIKDIINE